MKRLKNIFMILCLFVCLMVHMFNATFNNISVISWRSVLLVEETHHYLDRKHKFWNIVSTKRDTLHSGAVPTFKWKVHIDNVHSSLLS